MNRPTSFISMVLLVASGISVQTRAANPVIRDCFTADPAALVHEGRVYLYTGRDEAQPDAKKFLMKEWRCYSSDDLLIWQDEGSPMSLATFAWARSDAWAGQVIERDGKFFWYAAVHPKAKGFGIGVGVSDSPTGPFKDAIGKPLVVNEMTTGAKDSKGNEIDWDDIDPTVWIDDDAKAYLIWGNTKCRLAKLKKNMIEFDGPIVDLDLPNFTEAPWIHKYNGKYYLSYAYGFPEQIAYATADKIAGPYTLVGVINDVIPNSPTNHQAIIEFKNEWYFFYHTAALPGGGEYHRSVSIERLFYEPDGSIRPIKQTVGGLDQP